MPGLLENISPHVDEIVVIDGGPEGASTDGTLDILVADKKVVCTSNTYQTGKGGWDMARQRNDAINLATGDIYLFVSADMLFLRLGSLRDIVEESRSKIIFCNTLEFWQDNTKLRLYSADEDVVTVPAPILEPIALDRCLQPFWEEAGNLNLEGAEITDRAILSDTVKFHMGWIRPFREQVAKHIRNVKQGRWLQEGERLMAGGDRKLGQWAIRQVMDYDSIPSIAFAGEVPPELERLGNMEYNIGMDAVLEEYEETHGISALRG